MPPQLRSTRLGPTKMHQNLESTVTWLGLHNSVQGCLKRIDQDVAALAAQLSLAQPSVVTSSNCTHPSIYLGMYQASSHN